MRRYVLALLALAFSWLLPVAANAACPTDTGSSSTTDLTIVRDALKETCSNIGSSQAPVAPATATATKSTLTGGQYNSSPVTATTGQQMSSQFDAHGSGIVVLADPNRNIIDPTKPVRTYQGYSFANITTKTDTQALTGTGFLAGISINKVGSTDTLVVYDNSACSGTKIASITVIATDVWRALPAVVSTGICVTSGGGTAGDYTVYYLATP